MKFPDNLKYTKSHEWARKEGGKLVVGITEYAQKEISDVVFVEIPKLQQKAEQGKTACVIESVKAAFDIYAPVSGTIAEVNTELEGNPGMVNQDPYGQGWIFSLEMSDESQLGNLFTAEAYENFLKESVK